MSVHAQTQPRFSTYLAGHRVDPRARQRLIVAAIASTVTVAVAGAFGWTADKLGIQPVDAPTAHQTIMLEVGPPPPPPAPPPDQPSGGSVASDDPPPDDAPPQRVAQRSETPAADTDDDAVDLDKPPTGVPGPPGIPGGPPGIPGTGIGKGPGMPGGFGPPCPTCKRNPDPPTKDDVGGPVTQPVAVVKANAIFTPDPDQKALSRTKTGLMRPSGKSTTKVSFCVTTKGSVSDVQTVKRYPGDPEVDRICRDAVKKWRFRPLQVGGRAHKTCTTTTFVIEFE